MGYLGGSQQKFSPYQRLQFCKNNVFTRNSRLRRLYNHTCNDLVCMHHWQSPSNMDFEQLHNNDNAIWIILACLSALLKDFLESQSWMWPMVCSRKLVVIDVYKHASYYHHHIQPIMTAGLMQKNPQHTTNMLKNDSPV